MDGISGLWHLVLFLVHGKPTRVDSCCVTTPEGNRGNCYARNLGILWKNFYFEEVKLVYKPLKVNPLENVSADTTRQMGKHFEDS